MSQAVQIIFRDFSSSPAIEQKIHSKFDKLSKLFDHITSCKVVVALDQKNKHQGKDYSVHIELTVPKKTLVVSGKTSQDVYAAIRDSFLAIEKQLHSYVEKRKGNIKSHEEIMKGHVSKIMSSDGYGFILGIDGNEYYFSTNNVAHPQFEQLVIGDIVSYIPAAVSDGFHAHHVTKE